jgi:glycine hydroxymethyltransferase
MLLKEFWKLKWLIFCLCRGFEEKDFEKVADFFDRSVAIAASLKKSTGGKIKDFKADWQNGPGNNSELVTLANEVREFSRSFPTVGY